MSIRRNGGWTVSEEFVPGFISTVENTEVVFMVLAQDPPDNLQPPYNVEVMMVPSKIERGLPYLFINDQKT